MIVFKVLLSLELIMIIFLFLIIFDMFFMLRLLVRLDEMMFCSFLVIVELLVFLNLSVEKIDISC